MYTNEELNKLISLLNVGHIVITRENQSFEGKDKQLEYLQKIGIIKLSKQEPNDIVGAVLTDHGKKIAKNGGL